MDFRKVTEFVVVPPGALRTDVWAPKERLADHLRRQFPGYSFRIARLAPVYTGEWFGIYPVMNFVGADNQVFMCDEPPSWLLGEIRMACQAFDLRKSLAA